MKSVGTALRVLSEFAGDRPSWSVGELSARLGLGKSHVSKILATLRTNGFLRQDPATHEYTIGLRALLLGSQYLNSSRLVREALGPMRRLTDSTGHSTNVCVLDRGDIVYLASVEGPLFLDVGFRVGTLIPFHATAVGKLLVAFQDAATIDRIVGEKPLDRFTRNTICDPAKLKAHMAEIRRRGVSVTRSEGTEGLAAQAVPIFGESQAVVAALGFVYPAHVVNDDQRRAYSVQLHDAARAISAKLGARVYPFGGVD